MDLKATLKTLKLNEPAISTILGAIIIFAVAIFLINYFRTKPQTGILTPPTQTAQEETVKPGGKHTVAKSENLWLIAEKYYKSGYNWVDIAKANNIVNANVISEGLELTIPDITAATNTVEATTPSQLGASPSQLGINPSPLANSNAPPVDQQPISENSYTVAKGDHLWAVAVRAYGDGYKWTQIWEANRASIPNPNLIYVNQSLTLPRQ